MLIWEGPSRHRYKGKRDPIQAILTGYQPSNLSRNRKTGPMVQLWILPRDVQPSIAAQTGADASCCAGCPRRNILAKAQDIAACYEVLIHGPDQVWKSHRGHHADLSQSSDAAPIIRAFGLRFGAYGDPALLPEKVLRVLFDVSGGRHTGYTHCWRLKGVQWLKEFFMASVDNLDEMRTAQTMGWRTFRARKKDLPLVAGELQCPAAKEVENKTKQCWNCLQCNGGGGINITTEEH